MTSTSVNLFYWLFVMASPTFKRNYLLDLIKLGGIQVPIKYFFVSSHHAFILLIIQGGIT